MSHWTREFLIDTVGSLAAADPFIVAEGRVYSGSALVPFIERCHEGHLPEIARQLQIIEARVMLDEARAREAQSDADVDYSALDALRFEEAAEMIRVANAAAAYQASPAGQRAAILAELKAQRR